MATVLARIFEEFILPPGLFLLLLCLGFVLLWRKPILGKSFLAVVVLGFYLLSTPYMASLLIGRVQTWPALAPNAPIDLSAGAIVVLSAGRNLDAREYGGDTIGQHTLLRTRYGAFLQRKTGLPILLSGGLLPRGGSKSMALMMAESLQQDFNAGEVWLEDGSLSTAENAYRSKAFLLQKNIDSVYLVTQAWHMPRAVDIFIKAGLRVIPAPTAFVGRREFTLFNMLPNSTGLNISRIALREIGARIWYRLLF